MTIPFPRAFPMDQTGGETFKFQDKLPKLPIPDLESTLQKYLAALKPLEVWDYF